MAKIVFEGNVGRVETGVSGENTYISFSVAERFVYFDDTQKEWVEKGTEWHDCVIWVRNENTKKLERLQKFIIKGAGLLITGRTSVNPSEEKDEKGNAKYLNPYVIVDDVALTTERLEQVTYKPKSNNVANVVNDPELQQQGQSQQQPVQQPVQQPPVQQATPFDETPTPQNNF